MAYIDYTLIEPLGNGQNDGPQIQAALALGKPLMFQRGATYTINTKVIVPTEAEMYLNKCIINTAIPTEGGVEGATFFASNTFPGTLLSLAAPTVIGNTSFSVTAKTDLVVGGFVFIASATGNHGQIFEIKNISGTGPFTITVDRPLSFDFPATADTVLYKVVPAKNIKIYGDGTIINVTAPMDRVIEFSCVQYCLVENLTIKGPFGVGIALDVGSYRSTVKNLYLEGDPTHSGTGAYSESNEECLWENISIKKVAHVSVQQAGFCAYSGRKNVFRKISASECLNGAVLDAEVLRPSFGCSLEDCHFTKNAIGLRLDGAQDWHLRNIVCFKNTTSGVQLVSAKGVLNSRNVFDRLISKGNGNQGVFINVGSKNSFRDCDISENLSYGVRIAATGGYTTFNGGNFDSNGDYGIYAEADCRIEGISSYNCFNGGIAQAGTAKVQVNNSTVAATTVGSTWYALAALNPVSGGNIKVSDCNVIMDGTTGPKMAFIFNNGNHLLRNFFAKGSANTYGIYRNGNGSVKYDESTDVSGTENPLTGGTLTTSSNNEQVYA